MMEGSFKISTSFFSILCFARMSKLCVLLLKYNHFGFGYLTILQIDALALGFVLGASLAEVAVAKQSVILCLAAVNTLHPWFAFAWFPSRDTLLAMVALTEKGSVHNRVAASLTVESSSPPHFFIHIKSLKLEIFSVFLDIIDALSHGAVDHHGHHQQSHDKLHLELERIFSCPKIF